jgi:hypothetical protein
MDPLPPPFAFFLLLFSGWVNPLAGGHRAPQRERHVPEAIVRRTHAAVSRAFPEALKQGLFDRPTLWESTSGSPRLVVSAAGKQVAIHERAVDHWQTLGAFEALHVFRQVAVGVKRSITETLSDPP